MKRFFLVVLSFLILLAAVSCSGAGDTSDTTRGSAMENATTDDPDTDGTTEEPDTDGTTEEPAGPPAPPATSEEDEAPAYGNKVGERCPVLELPAYSGRGTFSIEETRGQITVLNFWATWCPPCVSELHAEFPRVTEAYGDRVAIVAVHVANVSEDVQRYINEQCADLDVIFCLDGDGRYYSMAGGELYIPHTVVLDENGVILRQIVGATDYESL